MSSGPIARMMTLFWSSTLNNKTANHHVFTGLNKRASADVAQTYRNQISNKNLIRISSSKSGGGSATWHVDFVSDY